MGNRARALTLSVAGLMALFAGCGGGDDDISTGDVSKQAYIAQADEICGAGDREIDRAGNQLFGPNGSLGLNKNEAPSDEQLASFIEETVIPNIQGQLDDLRELEAPEADADQIGEIYDTAQDNLDELADDPSAATGNDDNPFREANKMARDYGLENCGG